MGGGTRAHQTTALPTQQEQTGAVPTNKTRPDGTHTLTSIRTADKQQERRRWGQSRGRTRKRSCVGAVWCEG